MVDNNFIICMYDYLMDEVEGTKDYKRMSEKMKASGHDNFASMFHEMSVQEKGHAENIIKMLEDCVSKDKISDNSLKNFISDLNSVVSKTLD